MFVSLGKGRFTGNLQAIYRQFTGVWGKQRIHHNKDAHNRDAYGETHERMKQEIS